MTSSMNMSGMNMTSGTTPVGAVLIGIFTLIILGYLVRGVLLYRSGAGWSGTLKEFPHLCCALLMLPMLAVSLIDIPFVRMFSLLVSLTLVAFFGARGVLAWRKSKERSALLGDLSHAGMFAGMAFLFFVAYGSTLFSSTATKAVWALCLSFFALLSGVYLYRLGRMISRKETHLLHPRLPMEVVHFILAFSMFGMFAWPGIFM